MMYISYLFFSNKRLVKVKKVDKNIEIFFNIVKPLESLSVIKALIGTCEFVLEIPLLIGMNWCLKVFGYKMSISV